MRVRTTILLVAFFAWHPAIATASCTEADLNRAASISPQAWAQTCQRCGGRVTKGANNRCEGFKTSSSAGGSSGVDMSAVSTAIGDAMRQREEEIRQQHLRTMESLDASNRSRLANEQQRVEQAKDQKRLAEEARRKDALTRMGASPSDSGIPHMDFDDYRKRQAERADALRENKEGRKLSKKEQDWCKLHIPLKPTISVQRIEGQDEERMKIYELKKAEWDRRCGTPAPSAKKSP